MVTRTWNVAGIGDWKTAANWDSGVVPTPADLAIILADGNPQITKGANVAQLAFDDAYTNASFAPGADGTGGSMITHT